MSAMQAIVDNLTKKLQSNGGGGGDKNCNSTKNTSNNKRVVSYWRQWNKYCHLCGVVLDGKAGCGTSGGQDCYLKKGGDDTVSTVGSHILLTIASTNFPNVHLGGSIQQNRNVHVDSRLDSIPGVQTGTPTSVPSRLYSILGVPNGTPTNVPSRLVRHRQRVNQYAALVTKQQPLQPCRKHQVKADSQSIQYQRSLPPRSTVSFGIITLPQQRSQRQQYHAYRAQNTIIDSYKVAMEAHEQHKYAAIDSGASGHFYPDNYEGERHDTTAATIRVGCANKGVME